MVTNRYVHTSNMGTPAVSYAGSAVGTANRQFLHTNQQGSVIAITNNGGATNHINNYDAYGVPGSNNQGRFAYTGQLYLAELGLYHYRARTYSPKLGRFLQTDPVGYADQMNLYVYVGNDPINFTDPTGLYSRGNDWSDEEWAEFESHRDQITNDFSNAASALRNLADELAAGGDLSAAAQAVQSVVSDVMETEPSADNLKTIAGNFSKAASAMNDSSYVAHRGSFSGDQYGEAPMGGKSITIDPTALFTPHSYRNGVSHEVLHNMGYDDLVHVGLGTAYVGTIYFNRLSPSRRHKNVDHLVRLQNRVSR